MDSILTTLTLFIYLFKWLIKWKFTKDKLSEFVMFDIMPRNEPVMVDLGETPNFGLHFNITNQSPVDIELEQAEIEFVCVGVRLKSNYTKRRTIKPYKTEIMYVSESMNKGEAGKIEKRYKDDNSFISATLEFNCRLHNFSKHIPDLTGVKPEFINASNRDIA